MGGFFREDFLGRFFWEEFFGRNYLVEINKEFMFLSRFWGNFVSIKKEEYKSLGKLIALKNIQTAGYNGVPTVFNKSVFLRR